MICPQSLPLAGHYLLSCFKLGTLLDRPDLIQLLNGEHLFDLKYLGFDGKPPRYHYVPEVNPDHYLPRDSRTAWLSNLWPYFSWSLKQKQPDCRFYVEHAPHWLAPHVRQAVPCFAIYCFRDPRDIFTSANALLPESGNNGIGCKPSEDTLKQRARRFALSFARMFENYYAGRDRSDQFMIRYEEFVADPVASAQRLCEKIGIKAPVADLKPNWAGETRLGNRTIRQQEYAPSMTDLIVSSLHEEMSHLGYEVPSNKPGNSICFSREGVNLSSLKTRQGRLEAHSDFAVVHVQGRDFHLTLPFAPFDAAEVKEIWISVNSEVGEVCSIYWRGPTGRFSEERVLYARLMPAPHWTVLSFGVHAHPHWKGTIAELRLDLFNMVTRSSKRQQPYPPHRGTGRIRWVRLVA